MRNLNKSFGNIVTQKDVSLDVASTGLHSLIGPNGAGKTTLFNLLTGKHKPDSGSILFEGKSIGALAPHMRARLGIARSFQILSVFPNLTTFENVRVAVQAADKRWFGLWKDAHADEGVNSRVWALLEAVGLTDRAESICSSLSHGEKRLLEIAVSLAIEAKALVAAIDLIGEHIPRGSLTSAREKIVAALGEDPVHEGLQVATGSGDDPEIAQVVSRAIAGRRLLEIEYYKANEDEFSLRTIEPYALMNGRDGWYVASFDPARDSVRHFRLDRIKSAAVLDEQAHDLTSEGGFYRTLWHEIGHYLGVDQTSDGRDLDAALEDTADLLEEMKADLVSLTSARILHDRGRLTDAQLRGIYASGVRRVLQKNRPRREQPYQTMQLIQWNWFMEHGALRFENGRLRIDYRRYPEAVTSLLREVLARFQRFVK